MKKLKKAIIAIVVVVIGRMDGKGWFYCFPSPEDNRWFIIYLMEFGDIKEDTYEDAYWKVLASIRSKE